LKARVDDLSSLIQVSNIVSSTFDIDELIGLVMEKAQSVMRAEASSVMLINEEKNLLECEVALGDASDRVRQTIHLEKGQGLAGWVWENEESVIVPDVTKDERFYSLVDHESGFTTKSILAVPLIVKDKIIGVAEVINRTDGQEFSDYDLNLFITFCRQVALAIENARMHQMELEQERMRQQLESAKVIQQSFMPTDLPIGDDLPFEICAQNLPAIAVGGDLYDVFLLDNSKLGLMIGDVSGKGVPAALFMARLMSDFRFFIQQESAPEKLFTVLNERLVESSRQGMFVTLQYAVLNLKTGQVACCNGGHLPIIQVSDKTCEVHLQISDEGAPLGITKSVTFKTASFQLDPGDSLFFYTDGVIEAKNSNQEQYSLDRLITCAGARWKHALELLDAVLDDVKIFSLNMPQHDDITAMVVRWKGNSDNY
jgi:sigma-B regulation protein RsbU (phosphoserine phosphatase)